MSNTEISQEQNINNKGILLSSLTNITDKYEIIHPGIVTGRSIRSMSAINSILSSLSGIFGGRQNWTGIESILDKARDEAIDHMVENAQSYSPDAILGINIELSEIASGKSNALLVCTVTGTMCRKV